MQPECNTNVEEAFRLVLPAAWGTARKWLHVRIGRSGGVFPARPMVKLWIIVGTRPVCIYPAMIETGGPWKAVKSIARSHRSSRDCARCC
jgi:hypothetical protein